jgi:NAD(P)-dependent dehydrogenase (short-subunit alcohol dehydrogenase family)
MDALAGRVALIVGAGTGVSGAFARLLAANGARVALAARDSAKLATLCAQSGARAYACDATRAQEVDALFSEVDSDLGAPDIVLYNASQRVRGSILDLDPEAVAQAVSVSAFGGFLVAQQAARRMAPRGRGTLLFTGASASIKGYPLSASFAMGKFALRGLAQSVARELQPQGIHVAHIVIDGGIRSATRAEPVDAPDSLLDPEAIAQTYLQLVLQPRSAWSSEVELRPWVEKF